MKLEVEQRKNGGKKHVERSLLIKKLYRKLHPSVYILSVSVYHLVGGIVQHIPFKYTGKLF